MGPAGSRGPAQSRRTARAPPQASAVCARGVVGSAAAARARRAHHTLRSALLSSTQRGPGASAGAASTPDRGLATLTLPRRREATSGRALVVSSPQRQAERGHPAPPGRAAALAA
eukprot:10931633-Alexandrium_andersonii.AAC.1